MVVFRSRAASRRDTSKVISRAAARAAIEVLEGRRLLSGSLDTTFGAGLGYTLFGGTSGSTAINVVATLKQSDGNIAVVATEDSGAGEVGVLITRDAGGAAVGSLAIELPGGGAVLPTESTLTADGKIVIVGTSVADNSLVVLRYVNGALDDSFDGDGAVGLDLTTTELAEGFSSRSVSIDASGGILVAGQATSGSSRGVGFIRFDAAGTPDTGFDADGIALSLIGPDDTVFGDQSVNPAEAIFTDAGKIVVTGTASQGGIEGTLIVARYSADGAIDTTFDGDGWATYSSLLQDAHGIGVVETALPSGPGLLVGALVDNQFAVLAFDNTTSADGQSDLGIDSTNLDPSETPNIQGFTSDAAGNVYLGGVIFGADSTDLAVAKFDAEGNLDDSIGDGGIARIAVPALGELSVSAVTWSTPGTVLAAGLAESGEFFIAGVLDSEFDNPPPPINSLPVVAELVAPTAVSQFATTFAGSFVDADAGDSHVVTWDFGDGTILSADPAVDPSILTPSHTYAVNDQYTVTLSVFDGTDITAVSTTVIASSAGVVNGSLLVSGTAANDTVVVTKVAGGVSLSIGGATVGSFSPTDRIVINTGNGNDIVIVAADVTTAAAIDGGAGDDLILGGAGNDTLIGGAGKDLLDGRLGFWDVLDGGAGADFLRDSDGVYSAKGGVGNDVIDLRFAGAWTQSPTSTLRASDNLIAGDGGNDVLAVSVAASSLGAITFNLDADSDVRAATDGRDVVLLFGNYANGSIVNLDGDGAIPAGYVDLVDRLYAEHGGVNTGGDVYSTINSKLQAQIILTAAELQFLAGFASSYLA